MLATGLFWEGQPASANNETDVLLLIECLRAREGERKAKQAFLFLFG